MLRLRDLISRYHRAPSYAARLGLHLASQRRGVAALEFAIVAPVLLLMTVGALDVGRAVIVWQETIIAAKSVAYSATALAVPIPTEPATDSDLSILDATEAMTALYGVIPQAKTAAYTGVYSVTLSGVVYQTSGGVTSAYVIWSVPLAAPKGNSPQMQTVTRTCGLTTEVSTPLPETAVTLQTLPTKAVTVKSPFVVADVHFQYKPFFFWFVTGNIDFWETALLPPLIGNPTGSFPQEITFNGQLPTDTTGFVCQNQPPPPS